MRYTIDENTTLAGNLPINLETTIVLINMKDDTLIPLTDNLCIESKNIPGVYLWNTSNIDLIARNNILYENILYEMRSGDKYFRGKFVYGGYTELNKNIDNNVKNNNTLSVLNQTELKEILNDSETGLPKVINDINITSTTINSNINQVKMSVNQKSTTFVSSN